MPCGKSIAIVTQLEFWKSGWGNYARIHELFRYLSRGRDVTVIYLGTESVDLHGARTVYPDINIVSFRYYVNGKTVTSPGLRDYFSGSEFHTVIIEYLYLQWVTRMLPDGTVKILDAHDLLSDRARAFRSYGRRPPFEITEEHEFSLFSLFDKVMLIQEEEYKKARTVIGGKAILCLHPVAFTPTDGGIVNRVGFIGSHAQPNRDALIWLNNEVVPQVRTAGISFDIYGTITSDNKLEILCDRLNFIGTVESLREFYSRVSIVVNPSQYGGGLKIKTVESMGFGVPVITTQSGAQGLMSQAGKSFLLATGASEFAAAIDELMGSGEMRRQLVKNAGRFVEAELSPEACFSAILA